MLADRSKAVDDTQDSFIYMPRRRNACGVMRLEGASAGLSAEGTYSTAMLLTARIQFTIMIREKNLCMFSLPEV
ncbi:hypothetical protein BpHYR1_006050 [Brachionus plicatilis]|uniref:Uncharacterized protein n=1 Tax=Brachionus plicatilis TaxID=10195 RepID=A0A3M7PVB5_BRAPC|nr:hypothetical protein BpHYR1_006050 [Brachionus plicatilis]